MAASDATDRGWAEGDLLEVATPRGRVSGRLRISGIRPGVVFLPFHYGYWDQPDGHEPADDHGRAANELTLTDWDACSKQPVFKTAAAVTRLARPPARPRRPPRPAPGRW
jgi:anaerobic selenocysteine-containing dehydrogenase